MNIRLLTQKELAAALQLTREVFLQDVAPSYSSEGVAEFQKFINYEAMVQRCRNRDMFFFGAFEKKELVGVIAAKRDGHICLFFVKKEMQGRGIGRKLFQSICNYCVQVYGATRISVNAAPGSVEKYMHFGMCKMGEEQVENGIRSVPMELKVTHVAQFAKPKKTANSTIVCVILVAALVLIGAIAAIGVLGYNVVKNITVEESEVWEIPEEGDSQEYMTPEENIPQEESEVQESEDAGINAIPAYIDKDISYTIEEEVYVNPEQESQTIYLDIQVNYPKLTGLDSEASNKINAMLKECAMETADEIYLNPTDEIKERVLEADYPVLACKVEYKVTYANDDFISVVFQDNNMRGTTSEYHSNLRTLNIRLKDGKVYEVKDIVEINNLFVDEWLKEMRSEASEPEFLSELSKRELKKILNGDSLDGVYVANFFVADGRIEIGMDLNYKDDSSAYSQYAWVTAPFEFTKINKYATSNGFWDDL
ncbi:MAG: GNAT family N-acetyltransferase [Dorea sp.]